MIENEIWFLKITIEDLYLFLIKIIQLIKINLEIKKVYSGISSTVALIDILLSRGSVFAVTVTVFC